MRKFLTGFKAGLQRKRIHFCDFFRIRLRKTAAGFSKHHKNLAMLKGFAVFVIVYGLAINYMLFVLLAILGLEAEFQFWTFPAYGIAFWFLREELPRVVVMYRQQRGAM